MVKNLLLENLPVSHLWRDEAARRKTRSKKRKIYNCSVPWTKSEPILGRIRTRNFSRSGGGIPVGMTLRPLPSAAPSTWAAEFFGRRFVVLALAPTRPCAGKA